MAVLLPVTLPTVYETVRFVSYHRFWVDSLAITSVGVTVSSVVVNVRNTSNLLIVVSSYNTTNQTTGTYLGSGTTLVISGFHFGVFDDQDWRYILSSSIATSSIVTNINDLPAKYFSLYRYRPDVRLSTSIIINVYTSAGNFTLTQTVYNSWDTYRNLLRGVVDRSEVVASDSNRSYAYTTASSYGTVVQS